MSEVSGLDVSNELKDRIERAARERDLNPSSLIASALDLLLEAEAIQVEVARRRLASASGKTISNERVMEWLGSWGLDNEIQPPKCE